MTFVPLLFFFFIFFLLNNFTYIKNVFIQLRQEIVYNGIIVDKVTIKRGGDICGFNYNYKKIYNW